MPPLAIAGGIAAAGSIGGALIGSHAAGSAADAQTQAAQQAAALQHDSAQQALNFQKQQYNNSQQELSPFYQTGVGANINLANLLGVLPSSARGQQLFNPANASAQASQSAADMKPGTKPPGWSTQDWNALGKYQQIALTHPGADTSMGVKQSGARPEDISAAQWSKLSPQQQKSLMNVGNAYTPPQAQAGAQGGQTLGSLVNPSLGAAGSLAKPFGETFQAPNAVTEQNDPGYQFRLDQGMKALQKSAAAKGNLLTGGTLQNLSDYNQNAASGEYQNVYNRARETYNTHFNAFNVGQTNLFNRLSSLSGGGQTAANQLADSGQNFANNSSSILGNSANQIGQQMNNSAAATASGYIGGANAWGNALGGTSNNLASLYLANQGGYFTPSNDGGR